MRNKILVTGADGFIGSHLIEQLVKRGFNVKAFVYYNSQNSWGWLDDIDEKIKNQIEVVAGDIRDFECVKNALKGCDYVFNLAALIGIPYSYKSPSSYIDTNIKGIMNIMNAVKDISFSKIIHTSTSEVYGSAKFVPMTEKHQLSAQSPYAASKIGADQLAISYYKSFDLPVSILRPFNTFGPRQSLRAIIPTIFYQILNEKKKIKLGLLTTKRDFNHVSNTTDGIISLIKNKSTAGEVFNIGYGKNVSMLELIELIKKISRKEFEIVTDKQKLRPDKSEVQELLCDFKKIKKLNNFKPQISLEKGLSLTYKWFKKNMHMYDDLIEKKYF